MTQPNTYSNLDLWYLDIDGSTQHVTVSSQFVTFYHGGITYAFSSDGGLTYQYIFQPYSRVLRILSSTTLGWL